MARTLKRLLFALVVLAAAMGIWWSRSAPTVITTPSSRPNAIPRGGELIASMRSEPAAYNRYLPDGGSAAIEFVTLLTQTQLARINRANDQLEPWLAESWTQSSDGLTYTIKLRRNVQFSDGAPFTSDDVVFSFRAAYDSRLKSSLASALQVGGQPLAVSAREHSHKSGHRRSRLRMSPVSVRSCSRSTSPASTSCSRGILITSAATRTAHSCPISTN